MIVRFMSTYGSCHGHDCMIVGFTSIPIGRSKSYYHTIMTMTATIGRSKFYYHTIMTMTATIGRSKSWSRSYESRIYFYTNGSRHCHDCMIVGFTSTYGSCHGHDNCNHR
jgi:hypothetical protein